jgi:ketosteroid isomerase-like protein
MKAIRRASVLLACVALLIVTACKSAPPPAPPAPVSDEAGVRAWIDSFQKALESKDINAIMALYTSDVRAYDLVPPLQYVGSDAYRKDYESFISMFPGPVSLEFSDLHIQTTGDLAMIECLQHISATPAKGKKVDFWSRVTTGLRRENGKWLDFHDHVSVPADLDKGKALMDLKP